MRSVVHPRLVDQLRPTFFPSRATVEANAPERSPSGAQVAGFAAVAGLKNIPAVVAPALSTRRGEYHNQDLTTSETTHRIGLAGAFPAITAGMRLVVTGSHAGVYDITRPDTDSQSGMTYLDARIQTPTAVAGA